MSEKIEELEKAALGEKPWQLSGEVTAQTRPENSMLEEDVEFEQASRMGEWLLCVYVLLSYVILYSYDYSHQCYVYVVWLKLLLKWREFFFIFDDFIFCLLAPTTTEETTLQLEDIIKQRIKDQVSHNNLCFILSEK